VTRCKTRFRLMMAAAALLASACEYLFVMPPARVRLAGYQICTTFSEDLAVLQSSQTLRLGYVDTRGGIAIPPRYFEAGPFSEGLAPVQQDAGDAFGYVDRAGQLRIAPQYDTALPFSEGLAAVRQGEAWGFIDRTGALRIPVQYQSVWSFSEGRARASVNGLAGFIDTAGSWVAPPAFFKARDMREGLAAVCDRSRCGFIDRTGKVVVDLRFDDAGTFSQGLAPVRVGEKWGYVDRSGQMAIAPAYDQAAEFAGGLARVAIVKNWSWDATFGGYSGKASFFGFVDTQGKAVHQTEILGASSFSEGMAVIRLPSGGLCSDCSHYRLMRRDGTFLPGRFDSASGFAGGVAVVSVGQHSYLIDREGAPLVEFDHSYLRGPEYSARRAVSLRMGYIDAGGRDAIPSRYITAQPFSEGLAFVEGRWEHGGRERGYIDRRGSMALRIPDGISQALPFTEGLALVSQSGRSPLRYGFMNRAGTIVIAAQYADAAPFSEGLAAVKLSREPGRSDWGYIDRAGATAIAPRYTGAGSFSSGLAYAEWVTPERHLLGGVIDKTGRVVVDKPFVPELSRALFGTPSLDQYRQRRKTRFGEGLVPRMEGASRGWADASGRVTVRGERFAHLGVFSEGRAPVFVEKGPEGRAAWGFVDPQGRLAVEARYAEVQPFSDGLALVRDGAGRTGYVTPAGTPAIPLTWLEEAQAFSNGLAPVKLNDRWGYLDRTGRFAIPPRYFRAEPFSEGLAAAGVAATTNRAAPVPR
jgi:hypothetical protein